MQFVTLGETFRGPTHAGVRIARLEAHWQRLAVQKRQPHRRIASRQIRVDRLQQLEHSRKFRSHYWPTLLNLGILEAEQGHKVEAIRYFSSVLEVEADPSAVAEVNYRLAEIYVSLGKREQAVGHLRTAVVKAPSDPWGQKSEEYLKLLR